MSLKLLSQQLFVLCCTAQRNSNIDCVVLKHTAVKLAPFQVDERESSLTICDGISLCLVSNKRVAIFRTNQELVPV